MLYLLAIFLPPVAVLICGKPIQALLNVGLCILLWIPGVIHAWMVVSNHYADKRNQRVVKEVARQGELQRKADEQARREAGRQD